MTTNNWIWVTGVTGFSGAFLVDELRRRQPQAKILGIGRKPTCSVALDNYLSLDLLKSTAIENCLREFPPSSIYHLAAAMPPATDAEMWHQNVAMIYELLAALSRCEMLDTKVLSVGSAAELQHKEEGAYTEEDPSLGFTPYGKSKAAQTRMAGVLAKELGIPLYFARAFNFLGPQLPEKWVAGRLCKQLVSSQEKLVLGNLQAERDFVDIRDAVSAYCQIMEKGSPGEIYNVCTGTATAIEDLVKKACSLLGDNCPPIESDTKQLSRAEVSIVYGTVDKLQSATGWRAQISLEQSLTDMLESYRNG